MIKNMRDHAWQINVSDDNWAVVARLLEIIDPYLHWSTGSRPSQEELAYPNSWVYVGYESGFVKYQETMIHGLDKLELDMFIEYTLTDLEVIAGCNDEVLTAKILPLVGKYYGTEIDIVIGASANDSTTIKIWKSGASMMSKRQLEKYDIDPNDMVEVRDAMSDGHYESEFTFELANRIVDMVNNLPVEDSIKFVKMLRG